LERLKDRKEKIKMQQENSQFMATFQNDVWESFQDLVTNEECPCCNEWMNK
jgi:hypothetical protein